MNYFYVGLTVLAALVVYELLRFLFFTWLRDRAEKRMEAMHIGVMNLIASLKDDQKSQRPEA